MKFRQSGNYYEESVCAIKVANTASASIPVFGAMDFKGAFSSFDHAR
jgi:hypothetical protein